MMQHDLLSPAVGRGDLWFCGWAIHVATVVRHCAALARRRGRRCQALLMRPLWKPPTVFCLGAVSYEDARPLWRRRGRTVVSQGGAADPRYDRSGLPASPHDQRLGTRWQWLAQAFCCKRCWRCAWQSPGAWLAPRNLFAQTAPPKNQAERLHRERNRRSGNEASRRWEPPRWGVLGPCGRPLQRYLCVPVLVSGNEV